MRNPNFVPTGTKFGRDRVETNGDKDIDGAQTGRIFGGSVRFDRQSFVPYGTKLCSDQFLICDFEDENEILQNPKNLLNIVG